MNKEELPPLHKDTYYFGFGIDIEKPIEMANKIIELQQENKILKENAKHNDKVVDKVTWENMLLKKENKQLKDNIRQMDNSIDKLQKLLIKEKDNWNKLKEYVKSFDIKSLHEYMEHNLANTLEHILNKMQELERSDK